VSSVPPRAAELLTGPPRLQRPRPMSTTRQPVLMLSHIHVLSHDVATPTRSGSPGAQVVSRQRISVCGSKSQDILFHENSCEPVMVEVRKGSSSGAFLPPERGVSVISPPPPPLACISIACKRQGCRVRHTGPVQGGWIFRAHTPRFGLTVPTVSTERTSTRKGEENSEWCTTTVI
jgi:hypothetical protein